MNRIDRVELHGLNLATPFGPASVARAVLSGVAATPALDRVTVDEVRLEGVAAHLDLSAALAPTAGGDDDPFRFEPAGGIDGTLRAYITDAAWILDADVTIPIERGRIDFNDATVEHVGPDSSMGLSGSGVYVDAPNGRTELYRWATPAVPGARFERRVALFAHVVDRGSLELQPFVEALLAGLPVGAPAAGARTMLARTRLGGHLRLGDGVVGKARGRLSLIGRDQGRNRVELSSMPSGQGFGLRIVELSAADLRFEAIGRTATAATLEATLALHLADPAERPAVEARLGELTLRGVELGPAGAAAQPAA